MRKAACCCCCPCWEALGLTAQPCTFRCPPPATGNRRHFVVPKLLHENLRCCSKDPGSKWNDDLLLLIFLISDFLHRSSRKSCCHAFLVLFCFVSQKYFLIYISIYSYGSNLRELRNAVIKTVEFSLLLKCCVFGQTPSMFVPMNQGCIRLTNLGFVTKIWFIHFLNLIESCVNFP